jgi:hypothetical protein
MDMRLFALVLVVGCGSVNTNAKPDATKAPPDVAAIEPAVVSVSVPSMVEVEGDTGAVTAELHAAPTTAVTIAFSGTLGTYAPTTQTVTTDGSGNGSATVTFTSGVMDGTEVGTATITAPTGAQPKAFGFQVIPFERYGITAQLPSSGNFAANDLLGTAIVVPTAGTLRKFGFLSATAGPNLKIGIYTDAAGTPGTLVAQMPATAILQGLNEVALATPVALAAGTYWFMGIYDASGAVYYTTSAPTSTVKYVSLTFASALPTTFPTPTTYTGQAFNYYLVVGK